MPLCAERVQHPLPHLLRPRRHELRRHRDLCLGDSSIEGGLAELLLDPLLVRLDELAAQVPAQLLEVVEARVDREVLVEPGKLLALDLLHRHLEGGIAPRELTRAVVGREGELDRALLAGGCAEQRLLEAGDQVAAAELDELVAPLAALERLEARNPVGSLDRARADVVDHDEVAVLGGALGGLQAREPLAHRLYLLLDLLLRRRRLAARDLEAGVLAERRLREHSDLDREVAAPAPSRAARRGRARGRPPGRSPRSRSPAEYQLESVSRTASSRIASRPSRWITSGAGTLPRRKPGSFSSRPSWRALLSSASLHLAGGHLHLEAHA